MTSLSGVRLYEGSVLRSDARTLSYVARTSESSSSLIILLAALHDAISQPAEYRGHP